MTVLIVGAGPTGLTAAVELARRGIDAEVIDRRDAASTFSRAVGITPPSLVLLEASAVAGQLLDEGIRVPEVQFFRGSRRALTLRLDAARHRYNFILALPQDRTEAVLREAFLALGGKITYGRALSGLARDGDGVVARFADGNERAYSRLIGADGVRSTVRDALGIPFEGMDLPGKWSIADVDAPGWPHPKRFVGYVLPGGAIAVVVPIGAHRYRVVANQPEALSTLPVEIPVTRIHRESAFVISVRQVPRYSDGPVHLAGDAAHCHSPVGGRGMNLGIADACDLARRIADGDVAGYDGARHAAGAETIRLSEAARRVVSAGVGPRAWLRDAAFWVVDHVPALQRRVIPQVLDLEGAG